MKNRNDTTIDNNHNSIYNNDNNNTNNCIDKDENDNITSYPVVCMIRPATTLVQNNIIYPIKRRILWNIKISSDIFWSRNFFERSRHHLTFFISFRFIHIHWYPVVFFMVSIGFIFVPDVFYVFVPYLVLKCQICPFLQWYFPCNPLSVSLCFSVSLCLSLKTT